MLVGGIRPHFYCLPILKRNTHQVALLDAATSGNPKFFLGTDSAPHARHAKEAACGCAGCYTAYAAIEMYAEAFEQRNALDKLEASPACTALLSTACRRTPTPLPWFARNGPRRTACHLASRR